MALYIVIIGSGSLVEKVLRIHPIICLALQTVFSMWVSNLPPSDIIIPKFFIWVTFLIKFPSAEL